ncbi:bifunctional 2-polyprenyl-6-hydroxyphenol methylase/3-demethylubiquinol 3-O-methyltransferase UbiG [Fastidiosibacter lacustris]|uniref:bifunctional 2-polyprenyl-6-hydroxyphenol methylase/3-demethylubiquinol 3-O-methyltransferase UbiG n=1 Tax=Fastidiosibacter lacustris TaxID=2056695 RepID=UPI000E34D8EC|nr:bifunctional 2-polyprenyl-6-hydroxyphenol methylase/3-demethylubiquinol 3-O-methyltransferase UbiG [Fastidiosibacter lacustris]
MNVDQSEINKFSALAHQWWCEDGEFRTLHQVNPLRLQFIEQCVGKLNDLRVVDIGCGGGILTESLAYKGAYVTGLDLAEASLSIAKLHLLESGLDIRYLQQTVESLAQQETNNFDVVTCMEMLEHVPDPESIIASCARLVKNDGWLFFSTLNRNLKSYLLSIVMAEYVMNLIPKGTHEYAKYIKPMELIKAARKYGLQAIKIKGVHYNFLTKTLSLGGDADVNYIIAFKKQA